MATNSANAHGQKFIARVGAAMSEFFAAVAEAHRRADRYDNLSHLNNSEGEQMGLDREDASREVLHPRH